MDKPRQVSPREVEAAISSLKQRLVETSAHGGSQRVDCSPETIEQGLAKLVLTLIELLRQLLERQAIRRMEGGSLSDREIEDMGAALMKLEAKIRELAGHFGLTMADLNLELGPLGNLLGK
ncbi:MAG: gas vesicle protein K [Acidobacteriota bacterium]|jgi:phosphoribosylaminoimidazole-succinocarboxamide synthase